MMTTSKQKQRSGLQKDEGKYGKGKEGIYIVTNVVILYHQELLDTLLQRSCLCL